MDPTQPRALEVALMTEYSIWKTHDKHAQAFALLSGPRATRMGKLLGIEDITKEASCLSCHAMQTPATLAAGGQALKSDGVSCGGCHGPSNAWNGAHQDPAGNWRKTSIEDRFAMGFRDLRDPATRASLCASCHVGSVAEGKVVTHAMYAAGHPPLPPIEVATFSRNQPPHWREARSLPLFQNLDKVPAEKENRIKIYHLEPDNVAFQQTRLAVIGSVVALRETARLAQDRADLETKSPALTWPELVIDKVPADQLAKVAEGDRWPDIALAHSDCLSCHHDLKYPGHRQKRGFGYQLPGMDPIRVTPGRVLVRTWSVAPLAAIADFTGNPQHAKNLHTALKALAEAINARQYGDPKAIKTAAAGIVKWCDEVLVDLKKAKFDTASVGKLMLALAKTYDKDDTSGRPMVADYEAAKQIGSLLLVAQEEWKLAGGKFADAKAEGSLTDLKKLLDVNPYSQREKRLDITIKMIGKGQVPEGAEDFKKYVASNTSIGDPELVKKMTANSAFLSAVRGTTQDELVAELKKNSEALQTLGDEEEKAILKSIGNFDPDKFKANLKAIADAIK
jgi:Cytochrome c554 and c-prime